MTTPDLSDKYPHVDFLNLQFTNFGKKGFFSGKIETVICPDDNSKVKQILGEEGDGKILIVDGQGSTRVALMGDMIAESAEKNNWQACQLFFSADSAIMSPIKATLVLP